MKKRCGNCSYGATRSNSNLLDCTHPKNFSWEVRGREIVRAPWLLHPTDHCGYFSPTALCGREEVQAHLKKLESSARASAAKRGLVYELRPGLLEVLFQRQGGLCAITRQRMHLDKHLGTYRRPWAPSVDRVDSAKGYVEDNVQLVCVAANIAKSDWTQDVFRTLVTAAASNPFL
jgi:hypothetical protein